MLLPSAFPSNHLPFLPFSLLLLLLILQKAAAQCSLCANGSEPPDLSLSPASFDGLTCGDFVQLAALPEPAPDAPTCDEWLLTGYICGCPVPENKCSLCSDGSLPQFLDAQVDTVDCSVWVARAANTDRDTDATSCQDFWVKGLQCGCPVVPEGGCDLCMDGSLPPTASWESQPTALGGLTCGQARAAAGTPPYFLDNSNTVAVSCREWWAAGLLCDCPLPTTPCPLCEDDSSSLPEPEKVVGGQTCATLALLATFAADETECSQWQASMGVYCGCENPVASSQDSFCRICGNDNLLVDPNFETLVNGEDITCARAELNLDNVPCDVLQSGYGRVCPCPATESPTTAPVTLLPLETRAPTTSPSTPAPTTRPPTKAPTNAPTETPTNTPTTAQPTAFPTIRPTTTTCSPLCWDETVPPDRNLVIPDTGKTCGELYDDLQTRTSCNDENSESLLQQGIYCGCPTPPSRCSLCSDGSAPPDLDFIPPNLQGLSCRSLATAASATQVSTEEGNPCNRWYQVGLFCSCPAPDPIPCPLCADGSAVPNPEETQAGQPCRDLQLLATFAEAHDACWAWQQGPGLYCGCPNNSDGSVCRICGDNVLLPDTNRVVAFEGTDSDATKTCGELELNLEASLPCDELQQLYAGSCCPTSNTIAPSMTAIATEEPSATLSELPQIPSGSLRLSEHYLYMMPGTILLSSLLMCL